MGARELKISLFIFFLEDLSLPSRVDARLRCSPNLRLPLQGRAVCPNRAFLGPTDV